MATERVTRGTARPVHGGVRPAELRALGLKPEEVLDFSASVSPLGPPQGVWEALRRVDLAAYPDPTCLELREALSQRLSGHGSKRIGVERILIGNGSTELIHLLARAYLSPPQPGTANVAFMLTPTYGEYEGACRLAGASISCLLARRSLIPVTSSPSKMERGPGGEASLAAFSWDLEEACCRIAAQQPSLTFLCNPNNPTGVYLPHQGVESLAEATAAAGGLLVVDEAYISFANGAWDSLDLLERDTVVLVRSMTKDYALTGLRLGYSLASEEVTHRVAGLQPDWSVNALAQAAGLVALADTDYLPQARAAVNEAKKYLTVQLTSLGFTVFPSAANFLLVEVGDGGAWREKLMRRGLFVRDCASFGLPDCIRIGIRPLPDCQRLVRALAEVA